MRPTPISLVLLFVAGCASTPNGGNIGSARTSWNGATYDDVVAHWGTPVRGTKMSDGRDVYTWMSETVAPRSSIFPSLGVFGGSGGVGIGTGVTMAPGGGAELQRCERTLIFQNGRVVDQTWQGQNDFCAGFSR